MIKTGRTEDKKPKQLTLEEALEEALVKLNTQADRLKSMEADSLAFQDFVLETMGV